MASSKDKPTAQNRFFKEALAFILLSTCIVGSGLGIIYYLNSEGTFVPAKAKDTKAMPVSFTSEPSEPAARLNLDTPSDLSAQAASATIPPIAEPLQVAQPEEPAKSTEPTPSVESAASVEPVLAKKVSSNNQNGAKNIEDAYLLVFDDFLKIELNIQRDLSAYIIQYKSGRYTNQIYYDVQNVVERLDALADQVESVTPPARFQEMHDLYISQLNEKFQSTSDFLEGILHKNPNKIQSSIDHTTRSMEIAEQVAALRESLPRKD